MGVAWTKEQQKVIELRNRNILVSAAAGSGKTAVLVERIITMLTRDEQPMDVDRLLIVTFTEAAAAEMKERIRTALEKAMEEYPDSEHLKRQATLIHNAQITTIHSFCLSVIRDHFHVLGIDPGFRIGEEGELKLLRHDVLDELLEAQYAEGRQEFLAFASAYGSGRNDKKLEELILKIYEFSRSYPNAAGWLDDCVQAYAADSREELEASAYIEAAKQNIQCYLEDAKMLVSQAVSLCREPDGPAAYEAALLSDEAMIEAWLRKDSFAELSEAIPGAAWARLAANRDPSVSEVKTEQVKALREEVKKLVKDLLSQYFYADIEELLTDIRVCRGAVEELVRLVKGFLELFEEKKRAENMIDFSDMEQYALQILTKREGDDFVPSETAEEYQQQFLEIMIDEYQDSNLIQETILRSVSTVLKGRYNIFMVGDVKQSIYRFRLSRPELFIEKFEHYQTADSKTQRVDLHKNFRSRREVLDSINYIFRQIMTGRLGGITYDDQAALYVGADYKEAEGMETEILIADSSTVESEKEFEARMIAGRIKELLKHGQVTDRQTGQLRRMRYSDIVILTRSMKGTADVFIKVLNQEGIPAYAGMKEGYFETQEIGVLLNYLQILDNQRQDIPLASALLSPLGGFSEEELAVIRSAGRGRPFYQAVAEYGEGTGNDDVREDLQKRLRAWLETVKGYREIVPYTPIHELLWKIMDETGYEDYMAAMPGGEQRKANLEMLVEKARAFEATSYKGLFHFVRYIEQLKKYDVDYGEAGLDDEQADTVRVMTIHKSKGLEFPVVFAAGMGKRFNMQDARSSVALHAGMGIGLDAVNLDTRTKSPSIIKKVIQKEEALDSLGEELRVLYVAFTRAKEKLIITGVVDGVDKKLAGCELVRYQEQEELAFSRLSRASVYWDWLFPAIARLTPDIPIKVKRVTIEDIVQEAVEEEARGRLNRAALEVWDTEHVYDPETKELLREQFGYEYPYKSGRLQKMKFTVSELKERAYTAADTEEEKALGEQLYQEPDVVPLIPKFLKGETEVSGSLRGNAYHKVMELLDLRKEYSLDSVKESIRGFQKEGKIEEDLALSVKEEDIFAFLSCPIGKRMQEAAKSGSLYREQPFVLGMDVREVDPSEEPGEMILVQGIIDAYFEEPDGLVVLDYKTDHVTRASQLTEKYHAQLEYYAKALERMTEKKVKEKVIYSFTLQKEIRISC